MQSKVAALNDIWPLGRSRGVGPHVQSRFPDRDPQRAPLRLGARLLGEKIPASWKNLPDSWFFLSSTVLSLITRNSHISQHTS